jgi:hypothetical protein
VLRILAVKLSESLDVHTAAQCALFEDARAGRCVVAGESVIDWHPGDDEAAGKERVRNEQCAMRIRGGWERSRITSKAAMVVAVGYLPLRLRCSKRDGGGEQPVWGALLSGSGV